MQKIPRIYRTVHLGGKYMHHFTFFRKISLILICILVVLGCATDRASINTETGFSFTAEGSFEGIIIHFHNIPDTAVHLSVSFGDITGNGQIINDIMFWNNELFGFKISVNELNDLRRSPILLIPFVKGGHEYTITVSISTNTDLDDLTSYTRNVVANGGIYLTNSPFLHFTDNNLNLTLSEKPTFSEEVVFLQNGLFSYNVWVKMDDGTRGGGGNWNYLTFPAHEIYNGAQKYFGFTGILPVVASVQANLIHGYMEWRVGIATAEEILVSF